ncbi:sugar transporter SWEET1-like [Dendronephthya gigantea]|uniref:sugar transporter SWEET1-like n=1 Tax=Dendronephthya gigantea TaxID=151771 RepID=UPI00106B1F39|nr:sugar transporter SWEET1-like [Dendronephthya gigantea]
MTLVNYVSSFATLSNIFFFSSGILTCRKIIRNNSTENVSHLPFLITSFSCFMWIMYGITKRDSTIVFVNTIGMILQSLYLICHFIYSKTEPVFKHTCYILLLTFTLLSYFKLYIPTEDESLQSMGMTCVIITVIMFGSPLVALANIFRSRSTESLSFPLCVMTVVNSSLWMSYGYLINDIFVITPNFLGLLLGLVQVALFCVFPSSAKPIIVSL